VDTSFLLKPPFVHAWGKQHDEAPTRYKTSYTPFAEAWKYISTLEHFQGYLKLMSLGVFLRSRVTLLCGLAAFLIAGSFAVRHICTWPDRVAYSGDESYEGVALAEIVRLGQGEPIYAAGAANSFAEVPYGPLFYLAGRHAISLQRPSCFPLRLLSVFSMFGCAAGCGLLAYWLSRSYLAAFLAPLVFLSYGIVTDHGIQALSDAPALLLSFLGFLVAYRFRSSRAVLIAIPLMILGFYFKPQYLAGSAAVVLFFLFERQWRRAAEFTAVSTACVLALFGYFQWVAFSGQAFWRHFLLYQVSLLSWQRFGVALILYGLLFLLPLVFGIKYLRANENRLISCYLAVAVVLGLLTYSKYGSGVHYFFETALILSALVPAFFAKELTVHGRPIKLLFVFAIMVLTGQWLNTLPPAPSDYARHAAIQQYLRQNFPPATVSLGAAPGDLVQAGLRTPYASLFGLTLLAHRGVISDLDLVAEIEAHHFSLIVLSFDIQRERDPYWLRFYLTDSALAAVQREYVLVTSLDLPLPEKQRPQDRFYVYVPRLSVPVADRLQ
jgi:hypothetical protein